MQEREMEQGILMQKWTQFGMTKGAYLLKIAVCLRHDCLPLCGGRFLSPPGSPLALCSSLHHESAFLVLIILIGQPSEYPVHWWNLTSCPNHMLWQKQNCHGHGWWKAEEGKKIRSCVVKCNRTGFYRERQNFQDWSFHATYYMNAVAGGCG